MNFNYELLALNSQNKIGGIMLQNTSQFTMTYQQYYLITTLYVFPFNHH